MRYVIKQCKHCGTTIGTASPDINQILSDDEAVKRMIKSVKLYKPH